MSTEKDPEFSHILLFLVSQRKNMRDAQNRMKFSVITEYQRPLFEPKTKIES